MKIRTNICFLFVLVGAIAACGLVPTDYYESLEEVTLESSDHVKVYADWAVQSKQKPTIVLFHQGGSNVRGEYDSIMPLLFAKGYNVMAVDLRSGGDTFGRSNRTVMANEGEFSYCDAYLDMNAAIDLLNGSGYDDLILWGSSFSATLALRLAEQYEDQVIGVLAFSPDSGGPMASCKPDEAFKNLNIPVLLLRPSGEMEIPSVQDQAELARMYGHQVYIAENGTHGSSMLVGSRVEGDVSANWQEVNSFLNSLH